MGCRVRDLAFKPSALWCVSSAVAVVVVVVVVVVGGGVGAVGRASQSHSKPQSEIQFIPSLEF